MTIHKRVNYLKIAGLPPIKDFSEEITELAKGEEQAIAEVSCQGGQIWNGDHIWIGSEEAESEISDEREKRRERKREWRKDKGAEEAGAGRRNKGEDWV